MIPKPVESELKVKTVLAEDIPIGKQFTRYSDNDGVKFLRLQFEGWDKVTYRSKQNIAAINQKLQVVFIPAYEVVTPIKSSV